MKKEMIRNMPGSRCAELEASKDPKDKKILKRLQEYLEKAYECNYEVTRIQQLREQYKDVL